jgi:hypothetical protein
MNGKESCRRCMFNVDKLEDERMTKIDLEDDEIDNALELERPSHTGKCFLRERKLQTRVQDGDLATLVTDSQ